MVIPSEFMLKANSIGQKRVTPSATFMALIQRMKRVKPLDRYGKRAIRLIDQASPARPKVIRNRASQVPTFFLKPYHLFPYENVIGKMS